MDDVKSFITKNGNSLFQALGEWDQMSGNSVEKAGSLRNIFAIRKLPDTKPKLDSTKAFTNYKSSSNERINFEHFTEKQSDWRS